MSYAQKQIDNIKKDPMVWAQQAEQRFINTLQCGQKHRPWTDEEKIESADRHLALLTRMAQKEQPAETTTQDLDRLEAANAKTRQVLYRDYA